MTSYAANAAEENVSQSTSTSATVPGDEQKQVASRPSSIYETLVETATATLPFRFFSAASSTNLKRRDSVLSVGGTSTMPVTASAGAGEDLTGDTTTVPSVSGSRAPSPVPEIDELDSATYDGKLPDLGNSGAVESERASENEKREKTLRRVKTFEHTKASEVKRTNRNSYAGEPTRPLSVGSDIAWDQHGPKAGRSRYDDNTPPASPILDHDIMDVAIYSPTTLIVGMVLMYLLGTSNSQVTIVAPPPEHIVSMPSPSVPQSNSLFQIPSISKMLWYLAIGGIAYYFLFPHPRKVEQESDDEVSPSHQTQQHQESVASALTTTNDTQGNQAVVRAPPPPPPKDWSAWLSDKVQEAAVNGAVMLKQSPIPDALGSFADSALEGYRRVDDVFGVQNYIYSATQKIATTSVLAGGVLATAAIKAGVAYQRAPGYREDEEIDGDAGAQSGKSKGKPSRRQRAAPGRVEVLRISTFPGSIPKQTFEVSTQTVPVDISSGDSAADGAEVKGKTVQKKQSFMEYGVKAASGIGFSVLATSAKLVLGEEKTNVLLTGTPTGTSTTETARPAITNGEGALQGGPQEAFMCVAPDHRMWASPMYGAGGSGSHFGGPNTVVHLNVGGIEYVTTLDTLLSDSRSLIAHWFSSESQRKSMIMRGGYYFIDRDGPLFRHILNYLRSGRLVDKTFSTTRHLPHLRALLAEARYYHLSSLVGHLEDRIQFLETFDGLHDHKPRASYLERDPIIIASKWIMRELAPPFLARTAESIALVIRKKYWKMIYGVTAKGEESEESPVPAKEETAEEGPGNTREGLSADGDGDHSTDSELTAKCADQEFFRHRPTAGQKHVIMISERRRERTRRMEALTSAGIVVGSWIGSVWLAVYLLRP
ncbi:hypothetical protein BJ742DRAFT_787353 [Cladochytrium replicatum]|nr:hypothetical protein BJ742DRAFT_787353 [Cladochytrium replicatum]